MGKLVLWRSAGVGLSIFQVPQNLLNHLLFGNKSDDAELAPTLTLQRIGLIDPSDELSPLLAKRGAVFGREGGLSLGCGAVAAGERLKGEVCFFSMSPHS